MSQASDIRDNIIAAIRAINGSPTYTNRIREGQVDAFAQDHSVIEDDNFPHFAVVLQSEQREREPGHQKKILNFEIIASFFQPKTNEVESHLADIEKALNVDIRRGGFAYETYLSQIDRDSGALEEIQIYLLTVEVSTLSDYGVL
jgi:hypothetical protein